VNNLDFITSNGRNQQPIRSLAAGLLLAEELDKAGVEIMFFGGDGRKLTIYVYCTDEYLAFCRRLDWNIAETDHHTFIITVDFGDCVVLCTTTASEAAKLNEERNK